MKTKILNLIILGFICILLYSVFVYAKEGFIGTDVNIFELRKSNAQYYDKEEYIKIYGVDDFFAEGQFNNKFSNILPFNWVNYLERYPDLLRALPFTREAAINHWKRHGYNENRIGSINLNEFDWKSYLERYPDLLRTFSLSKKDAIRHWVAFGYNEGRDGSKKTSKHNSNEGFSETDAFGQWELLIRQSYNDQFNTSPFNGINTGIHLTAKHDYKGDILAPNYYNPKLLSSYDFSSNYIFKIHSYEKYEDIVPQKIFTWSQGFDQNAPIHVRNRTSNFSGLEKGTASTFAFKEGPRLFNRIVIRHPDKNVKKVINLRELQVWINNKNVLTNAGMLSTQTGDILDCDETDPDNNCEETLDDTDETIDSGEADGGDLDVKKIEFINWNTKKVLTSWWSGTRYPQRIFQASNIANKNIGRDLNVHSWHVAGVALYIPLEQSYLIDDIQALVLYNRANTHWRKRLAGFQIELYYNNLDEPFSTIPISATGNHNAYVFKGAKWNTVSDGNKIATNSHDKILTVSWAPQIDIPVNAQDSYVIGASQSYLEETTLVGEPGEKVEKLEVYLWNPRPKNKNTFNRQFDELGIQKVNMSNTAHKYAWNKTADLSGVISDTNPFSYCFGKLRCNDNRFTPVYDELSKTYKPYCNGDSSNNPVYCEGSILYNTGISNKKRVPIGSLEYDMMGKYADYNDSSNSQYFNLFRGLTIPTNDTIFDPELVHNNVVFYNEENKKEAVNICEFLDNLNMENGTNIQTECKESLKANYKSCVANHGEKVEPEYFNYICDPNEKCVGYECGVQFGKCTPAKI